jgi:hypothetical protein
MVAIATELMSKVAYGVKVRAGIGGSVSMLDLISDTVVIVEYIMTGRSGLAYMLIGMVALNMFFQLILVWIQTRGLRESKWKTMVLELVTTVCFLKPGLDSWKVASGAEQPPGAAVSPLVEMTCSRGMEMVFEAVPGMVLQFVGIMNAKKRTATTVVSLLISAASTGLTATTLFYDTDVDPGMRKRNPVWIGAIPNQGRGLAFVTVFAFSTLHVLAKGAATALFCLANPRFLMIYMAVDYGLYLVYFAARRDLVFFTTLPPTASYIVSPLIRIIIKVIGDFSGSPLVRAPVDLGGSYYMFNQISSQASVLIAAQLYNVEMAEIDIGEKIAEDTVWKMATALVAAWCLTMLFFLTRIVTPTHRHTFWSLVSGRQSCQEYFTKGETDEGKLDIFGCNRLLWEGDIGSDVMAFTLQNWGRWEREKPAWFTPQVKASVPDEYIPREFLAALGGANRMRRGSAAGSVRESFRLVEDAVLFEEVAEEDGSEFIEDSEAVNVEEEEEEEEVAVMDRVAE